MAAGVVGALVLAAPAQAAFPGANGKIAFHSDRESNRDIYSMNADGSGAARLTDGPAEDSNPAWSADGRQIVFQSNRGGDFSIFKMDANGSGQALVIDLPGPDYDPSWSPDGEKIVFGHYVSAPGQERYELYTVNLDGTGLSLLRTSNRFEVLQGPEWKPNGPRIAFHITNQDPNPSNPDWSLWTTGSTSSGSAGPPSFLGAGYGPNWSPDGEKLAFGTADGIYLVGSGGGARTLVTHSTPSQAGTAGPAWSPDSDTLPSTPAGIST